MPQHAATAAKKGVRTRSLATAALSVKVRVAPWQRESCSFGTGKLRQTGGFAKKSGVAFGESAPVSIRMELEMALDRCFSKEIAKTLRKFAKKNWRREWDSNPR